MNVLTIINIVLASLLVIFYAYQFVYIIISLVKKLDVPETDVRSRIAVLICARNEEGVIGRLIDSLHAQDYPVESFGIFVACDNCTDSTAEVVRSHGAIALERADTEHVGKGYAMDFLIRRVREEHGGFDAYAVFDADNVVDAGFLREMNRAIVAGYDCVTGYRGSLNYGDNWISAGQGMCFLRDMVLLNRARMVLGGSSFVSGTGYVFSERLCERFGGGWPFTTMTEDCEFTMYCTTEGVRMGYMDGARFLDEQPTRFVESWRQRLRWCRGGIQVFRKYFGRILRGIFHGRAFASFDMAMCMVPAYLLSVAVAAVNTVGAAISLALGENPIEMAIGLAVGIGGVYLAFLVFSLVLTVTEWRSLDTAWWRKLLYMLTFPFFMLTFVPITCVAILKRRGKWHATTRKGAKEE